MKRDLRFDFIRVISMTYIVAVLHLSQYLVLPSQVTRIYNSWVSNLFTDLALSLFSMISGYLIGSKYTFDNLRKTIIPFYKKRILRFYPLFIIASVVLCLIGFNTIKSSLYGFVGLAPFVADRPRTLWYISMLIVFYLVTPFVSRGKLGWKVVFSAVLVGLSCVAFKLIKPMDFRFVYNLAFYLIGIILSRQHVPIIDADAYLGSKKMTNILAILSVILFLAMVPIAYFYMHILFWPTILMGVLATFSVSRFVVSLGWNWLNKSLLFVSDASMVCYMFHRFFYYVGVKLYNFENQLIGWVYLLFVIFPICVIASWYIQKGYNRLLEKLNNKH